MGNWVGKLRSLDSFSAPQVRLQCWVEPLCSQPHSLWLKTWSQFSEGILDHTKLNKNRYYRRREWETKNRMISYNIQQNITKVLIKHVCPSQQLISFLTGYQDNSSLNFSFSLPEQFKNLSLDNLIFAYSSVHSVNQGLLLISSSLESTQERYK